MEALGTAIANSILHSYGIEEIMAKWEYGTAMFHLDTLDTAFESERIKLEEALNLWGRLGFELISFAAHPSGAFLAIFKKEA